MGKWVLISFTVLGVSLGFYSLVCTARKEAQEETSKKEAWYSAHHCVREGYTGGSYPYQTYRCDNGLYIWRDIPTE